MHRVARAVACLLLVMTASAGLVALADGRIAVAVRSGTLQVHAPGGERLASVATGAGPRAIVAHGGRLFVANRGIGDSPGSTITILDGQTLALERTAQVCSACAPRDLGFDAGGTMWFAGQAHRAIYWSGEPWSEPAGSVVVGVAWPSELAMSDDGALLGVGFRDGESVVVINTRARTYSRVEATRVPTFVAARPGAREFWFGSDIDGEIVRVRVAPDGSLGEPETVKTKAFSGGIAFVPDGSRVVVSDVARQTVSVLDAETGSVVDSAELDVQPGVVAMDPAGGRFAVLADGGTRVMVFTVAADGSLSQAAAFPVDGVGAAIAWIP